MKQNTAFFYMSITLITMHFYLHSLKTSAMTFNVRRDGKESSALHTWQNRIPLIQAMLSTTKPDILGLQEAGFEQIQDIQKILGTKYNWIGTGRQQQGIAGLFCTVDEHTPIFYNTDQYTLLQHDTFWLNPHKIPKKSGWGAWLNRICTWAQLHNKKNKKNIWIFNTHLDHRSKQARSEGLKLILNEITSKTKNNELIIIMGDFNAPIDSDHLKLVVDQYGLCNTKQIAKNQSGPLWTAFKNGWSGSTHTIDHILINAPTLCSIVSHTHWTRSDSQRVSDHNPVYITLNY